MDAYDIPLLLGAIAIAAVPLLASDHLSRSRRDDKDSDHDSQCGDT
ncbi:hypothetical protein [Gordonia lacunae]|nr:hypothetical protein [Gordonia lacunae]